MADVKVIPPREKEPSILRVAAYCRVSSDSTDQLHSYASQIRKYTEVIRAHEDWELVDIYADEGLTGTRMEQREDFNRMLSDCRKGRIDRILVKSISRFARNTKDCLSALRELMSLGVTVCFEKENIDTETLTTELMVSVSGALAQQESLSISQNLRISYRRRMERGEFITTFAPFGYRLVNGKDLEIVPDEAEWVRWIFDSYLAGHSTVWIAEELKRRKVWMEENQTSWYEQTVWRILNSEKYIGDALCQKNYTLEVFPFVSRKNKGEVPQYYVENTHPAIISRDVFERAQALMKMRSPVPAAPHAQYLLSHKVFCGNCGAVFTRKASKGGWVAWGCRTHERKSEDCAMGRIPESEIYAAFARMYHKLKIHGDNILLPAVVQLRDLNDVLQKGNPAMLAVNRAIAETSEQSHKVSILQSKGILDGAACTAKLQELEGRLTGLRRKRRQLLRNEDLEETVEALCQTVNTIRRGPDRLENFDDALFSDLVEKITVQSHVRICFHLYGGIELTECLREVGR